MRALVLEEGTRTVAPQRVWIVDRGLRRGHGHLHRFIARKRLRVIDRSERRRFADKPQALERRAAAGKRGDRYGSAGREKTGRFKHGDNSHSARAFALLRDGDGLVFAASRGVVAATLTRPGPTMVA